MQNYYLICQKYSLLIIWFKLFKDIWFIDFVLKDPTVEPRNPDYVYNLKRKLPKLDQTNETKVQADEADKMIELTRSSESSQRSVVFLPEQYASFTAKD